jgi:hypothetical protein
VVQIIRTADPAFFPDTPGEPADVYVNGRLVDTGRPEVFTFVRPEFDNRVFQGTRWVVVRE